MVNSHLFQQAGNSGPSLFRNLQNDAHVRPVTARRKDTLFCRRDDDRDACRFSHSQSFRSQGHRYTPYVLVHPSHIDLQGVRPAKGLSFRRCGATNLYLKVAESTTYTDH